MKREFLKNKVIFFLLTILAISCLDFPVSVAQDVPDTLYFVKRNIYTSSDDMIISENHFRNLAASCPDASAYLRKALSCKNTANVFYSGGVIFMTLGLISPEVDQKLLWGGVMLGFDIIGLLVITGYKPNIRRAIHSYNQCIRSISSGVNLKMQLGMTQEGIGLVINF